MTPPRVLHARAMVDRAARLQLDMMDNPLAMFDEVAEAAARVEDLAERADELAGECCGCVLPEQSCAVCRAAARQTYPLDKAY